MQTTAWVVWVYGALVLVGGILGWAKAKSKASLISGILFGVALLVVGAGIYHGDAAHVLWAAALAAVLMLTMGVRFAKTRKLMPAGLLTFLSLAVAVFLLLRR
jgi:uncharacterized membrane protein (UPF0136 family)